MLAILNFLRQGETAASAVEYALLLAAIALVAFFALRHVGTRIDAIFDSVRTAIRRH